MNTNFGSFVHLTRLMISFIILYDTSYNISNNDSRNTHFGSFVHLTRLSVKQNLSCDRTSDTAAMSLQTSAAWFTWLNCFWKYFFKLNNYYLSNSKWNNYYNALILKSVFTSKSEQLFNTWTENSHRASRPDSSIALRVACRNWRTKKNIQVSSFNWFFVVFQNWHKIIKILADTNEKKYLKN